MIKLYFSKFTGYPKYDKTRHHFQKSTSYLKKNMTNMTKHDTIFKKALHISKRIWQCWRLCKCRDYNYDNFCAEEISRNGEKGFSTDKWKRIGIQQMSERGHSTVDGERSINIKSPLLALYGERRPWVQVLLVHGLGRSCREFVWWSGGYDQNTGALSRI